MPRNLIALAIIAYDSERLNEYHYTRLGYVRAVLQYRNEFKGRFRGYPTWYLVSEVIYIDTALNQINEKHSYTKRYNGETWIT